MNKNNKEVLIYNWLTQGFRLFNELSLGDKSKTLDEMCNTVGSYRHDMLIMDVNEIQGITNSIIERK